MSPKGDETAPGEDAPGGEVSLQRVQLPGHGQEPPAPPQAARPPRTQVLVRAVWPVLLGHEHAQATHQEPAHHGEESVCLRCV